MNIQDILMLLYMQFKPSFDIEEVDLQTLEFTINGLQFNLLSGEQWLLTFRRNEMD